MVDYAGVAIDEPEIARWDRATLRLWQRWALQGRPGNWRLPPPVEGLNVEWTAHHIPVPEDLLHGAVLEIGCGLGFILERHLRGGPEEYLGIDVSRYAVAGARGRFWDWPGVTFAHTVDDADLIRSRRGQFDVVFGHSLFIHLDLARLTRTVEAAADLLRHGGYLSIDVRTGPDAPPATPPPDWIPGQRFTTFGHQPEEIVSLVSGLGYEDVRFVPAVPVRGYVIARRGADIEEIDDGGGPAQ